MVRLGLLSFGFTVFDSVFCRSGYLSGVESAGHHPADVAEGLPPRRLLPPDRGTEHPGAP